MATLTSLLPDKYLSNFRRSVVRWSELYQAFGDVFDTLKLKIDNIKDLVDVNVVTKGFSNLLADRYGLLIQQYIDDPVVIKKQQLEAINWMKLIGTIGGVKSSIRINNYKVTLYNLFTDNAYTDFLRVDVDDIDLTFSYNMDEGYTLDNETPLYLGENLWLSPHFDVDINLEILQNTKYLTDLINPGLVYGEDIVVVGEYTTLQLISDLGVILADYIKIFEQKYTNTLEEIIDLNNIVVSDTINFLTGDYILIKGSTNNDKAYLVNAITSLGGGLYQIELDNDLVSTTLDGIVYSGPAYIKEFGIGSPTTTQGFTLSLLNGRTKIFFHPDDYNKNVFAIYETYPMSFIGDIYRNIQEYVNNEIKPLQAYPHYYINLEIIGNESETPKTDLIKRIQSTITSNYQKGTISLDDWLIMCTEVSYIKLGIGNRFPDINTPFLNPSMTDLDNPIKDNLANDVKIYLKQSDIDYADFSGILVVDTTQITDPKIIGCTTGNTDNGVLYGKIIRNDNLLDYLIELYKDSGRTLLVASGEVTKNPSTINSTQSTPNALRNLNSLIDIGFNYLNFSSGFTLEPTYIVDDNLGSIATVSGLFGEFICFKSYPLIDSVTLAWAYSSSIGDLQLFQYTTLFGWQDVDFFSFASPGFDYPTKMQYVASTDELITLEYDSINDKYILNIRDAALGMSGFIKRTIGITDGSSIDGHFNRLISDFYYDSNLNYIYVQDDDNSRVQYFDYSTGGAAGFVGKWSTANSNPLFLTGGLVAGKNYLFSLDSLGAGLVEVISIETGSIGTILGSFSSEPAFSLGVYSFILQNSSLFIQVPTKIYKFSFIISGSIGDIHIEEESASGIFGNLDLTYSADEADWTLEGLLSVTANQSLKVTTPKIFNNDDYDFIDPLTLLNYNAPISNNKITEIGLYDISDNLLFIASFPTHIKLDIYGAIYSLEILLN